MLRSEQRILTTHAGSLPRPRELDVLLGKLSRGEAIDRNELEKLAADATRRAVVRQLECGIDIGNNGEQSRESFFTYVQHRMSGFSGRGERPRFGDIAAHPSYLARLAAMVGPDYVDLLNPAKAIGEVRYVNREPLDRECADYLRIAAEYQPGI